LKRCREILHRINASGGEPLGETPVKIDVAELLTSVKQEFLPSAQRLLETTVVGPVQRAVLPPDATRQALKALVQNALDASTQWASRVGDGGVSPRQAPFYGSGFGKRHEARNTGSDRGTFLHD
jgi:hypothetical protein